MKDGKMVMIAYHLLESSIGAYTEWLVNELMMTINKMKYKDARLVMLPQTQQPTSQISLAYLWSLLFFSYRVSLAEYNRVLRVLSPLLPVIEGYLELTLVRGNLLVSSERISFTLRP